MHKLLDFHDKKLLRTALTHRSYINENPEEEKHNERLEFLGDALINFLCAEYLYEGFPQMAEDEMTRRRAALVDEKQLAKFAQEVGIDLRMRLGKGTIRSGGYQNENLQSSTFEAVVAAYYLDNHRDLNVVRKCIRELFESVPTHASASRSYLDAKNCLQEVIQANDIHIPPKYITERVGGPDHSPEFLSIVYVNGKEHGRGKAKSKKEAEKRAAEDALIRWKNQKHSPI